MLSVVGDISVESEALMRLRESHDLLVVPCSLELNEQ
jgi:hypothetical protein